MAEAALDDGAAPVTDLVEADRATTGAAAATAVGLLVSGIGVGDPAAAQQFPVGAGCNPCRPACSPGGPGTAGWGVDQLPARDPDSGDQRRSTDGAAPSLVSRLSQYHSVCSFPCCER